MTLAEFYINGKTIDIEQIFLALLEYEDEIKLKLRLKDILIKENYEELKNHIITNNYLEREFVFLNKNKKEIKINGVFVKEINCCTGDKLLFKVRQKEFISNSNKINEDYNKYDEQLQKLIAENTERLKELAAINQTTHILKEGKTIEESLHQIVSILPKAWQYPDYTVARIIFNSKEFRSSNFVETEWKQSQIFKSIDGREGLIEVFYTKYFPEIDEGPFMKEERALIANLSELIVGYINSIKAKEIIKKESKTTETDKKSIPITSSSKMLQEFLNKNNTDRDLYHDLMPFKVREILLVANLYDAYIIEKEGRFTEHILGEYHHLNLTSLPRITGVTNTNEAMEMLRNKHFDMVIIMIGVDKKSPVELSKAIKNEFHYIPVFVLLNNNNDIKYFDEKPSLTKFIDKIFVWNGDSKVFFAMVKLIEDKINVENDTNTGMVRVIILVEDSAKFYSRYLPMLYHIVLGQTKQLIEEAGSEELYKVLKLRARPKILHAATYEEAIEVFNKYKDYLLCLISDMKFCQKGSLNDLAGVELVKYVRQHIPDLPIVIQSSDNENEIFAHNLKTSFIYKNSESLIQDFKSFITYYLGFGNFIYRDLYGRQIAVARTIQEFEQHLKNIPVESLLYHAMKNHFSLWLMARGEIRVAKKIIPLTVNDFKSPEDIRNYILDVVKEVVTERNKGKIIPFDDISLNDENNIISLSSGALGGKGRGLSFINALINNFDFSKLIPNINICAPRTFIIGTDEFEMFIERNKLHSIIYNETDYEEIRKIFIEAKLGEGLKKRLKKILKVITKPIAVRSSGLFEDSLMQPFAGIFETYLLPNNHKSIDVRLEQTLNAIKLVYASVYSKLSKGYIEAINYKIEEEKMAVIIQEVVGNEYEGYFYPHISGVAQSYNYYPYAHMKPEEGFAVAAVGLGKYVVEGEKAYRFSPKYPDIEINSPKDQYKNSQLEFYALNLNNADINLLDGELAGMKKLEISDAEKHDNLKHCASVFDFDNERIIPGLTSKGPRIVNFANILKYNYIPLAKTIEVILELVRDAFGSPVEIEFAVDLNKDKFNKASFYLLQIKPLIGNSADYSINENEFSRDSMLLYADKGMGNGIVENIYDVVYVDLDKFDKGLTVEMTHEIEELNKELGKEGKKYILIGPGRWGTRDRFIGIPVTWPQISNAKIIVETSLDDFPLDASLGSHFFHNVTSMNVGYLSVQHTSSKCFIDWNLLEKQKLIKRTNFIKHVRFESPLTVRMDGKQRISIITF